MCLDRSMQIQTKFLRLRRPAALGDRIDGWRVCWLGGWDRCRVFYVVMVEKEHDVELPDTQHQVLAPGISRAPAKQDLLNS